VVTVLRRDAHFRTGTRAGRAGDHASDRSHGTSDSDADARIAHTPTHANTDRLRNGRRDGDPDPVEHPLADPVGLRNTVQHPEHGTHASVHPVHRTGAERGAQRQRGTQCGVGGAIHVGQLTRRPHGRPTDRRCSSTDAGRAA